jgi:hypothetical protein
MREQLTTMAIQDNLWEDVFVIIDPLLDAYRGRERLLQLYRRIGYGTFFEECSEAGIPDYPARWKDIAERRNQFAHSTGERNQDLEPLTPLIVNAFVADSLTVFCQLHNKYNRETIAHQAATERRNPWREAELGRPSCIDDDHAAE